MPQVTKKQKPVRKRARPGEDLVSDSPNQNPEHSQKHSEHFQEHYVKEPYEMSMTLGARPQVQLLLQSAFTSVPSHI